MQVKPHIETKNRTSGQKQRYRIDQPKVVMGRDRSNDIVLEGRTVSRRHAELIQEADQFFVRDLKSGNGTLLNDKKLPPGEKALLQSGDVLQIGDYNLHFGLPRGGDAIQAIYETTDTDVLEIKMIKKLLRAIDRDNAPSIEVLEGPTAGSRFVLEGKSQEVILGRDPACEFVIDSEVISRKHARIEKRFDTVTLHDLGSKNGTYVNREKVREKRLADGDVLHLGTLPLIFRNPQELSFDLPPPEAPEKEPQKGVAPPPPEPPTPSGLGMRAVRRPPTPVMERVKPLLNKLSLVEVLAVAIGAAVLIGSLWGILKILGE